jgi:hypothetical protein
VEQSLKSTVRFRAWKRQTKCRSQYQELNESNREYKETTGSHGSGVSGSRRCHDDTSSVLWEPALGIFACCARFLRARESVPTHDVQTKDTIMSWLWRHTQLELEQHACFARVELASGVLWRLLMFCRKKSTYGYSSGMIVEHAPNSSSTWRMELKHSIRPASQWGLSIRSKATCAFIQVHSTAMLQKKLVYMWWYKHKTDCFVE